MTAAPSEKVFKNNPIDNNPLKNDLEEDVYDHNMKMFNQLALQPNITIKRKVIIKLPLDTHSDVHTKNKLVSCQNNSQIRVIKQNKKPKVVMDTEPSKNVACKKISLRNKFLSIKNDEYYPERCKRNIESKKIILPPKHEYKVVGTTNKRKRRIPQREVSTIQPTLVKPSPPEPLLLPPGEVGDLSLSSLVLLAEDQGLDDEDLMEILTCPSPVWWEESGEEDEDCDGDTTGEISNINKIDKKTTTDANANRIPNNGCKTVKNDAGSFKKFVRKRSKLETILSNIKCKKTKSECHTEKEHANSVEQYINNTKEKIYIEHTNDIRKDDLNNESTVHNEFRNRTRKHSLGGLSDVSINEEDLLDTLESIELPVQEINEESNAKYETSNVTMVGILNKPAENNLKCAKKLGRKIIRKLRNKNTIKVKNENDSVQVDDGEITYERDIDIPPDLPPLTENPYKNTLKAYDSPKSMGSANSETTHVAELDSISVNTNVVELDSISDTNVKFLDEYVDDKKETTEAVTVKNYGKDGELITVYQIVSNNFYSDVDIEKQIKVNLVNKLPQNNVNKNDCEIDPHLKTRKSAFRSRSKYKRK